MNFNQPPPGFIVPNQQHNYRRNQTRNVYSTPPPFNVPPPSFALPSPMQFSAPPPPVPQFTAPPPNWNSSAAPTYDGFLTNQFKYNSSVHQPPSLDMFKYPPPPPPPNNLQSNNGYGHTNQVIENRHQPSSTQSESSSYSSNASFKPQHNHQRSSFSSTNNTKSFRPNSHSNSQNASSNYRSQSSEPSRDRSGRDNRDSRDYRDRRERSSSRSSSDRNDYNRQTSSSSRNERSTTSNRSDRSGSRDSSRSRKDYRPSSSSSMNEESHETEREELLTKWRSNYCEHFDDIKRKLTEMEPTTDVVAESWIRSSPSDIYYERSATSNVNATPRLVTLCSLFESDLLKRGANVRAGLDPYTVPPRRRKHKVCRHKCK